MNRKPINHGQAVSKSVRENLHLNCLSICARVRILRIRSPDRVLFTLHPRLGSEVLRGHGHFGSHMNRQLWACALHNLGRTWTSTSKEIATCSDELGHGRMRQKFLTRTWISVNMKHQFTCFDCVWAQTRMLGPVIVHGIFDICQWLGGLALTHYTDHCWLISNEMHRNTSK